MGKPLSRPGCFRKSSCCLEKHGAGDGGVGGRAGGVEGGYGDGYVPQRSIYDTMCINQQIDSHHHHPGGSIRRDCGGEGSFSYSASGSLRLSRPPADMFEPQPRSLTPNPSFVRRLDERAIYDSLKLGGQDADGEGCHSPRCFTRSVSPSVSSFSVPGVSASSSKKHHHHHHHGDSTKSRDGRHSWKVLTPPKHLECLELTTTEMMDRGSGYLNPGHYPPPGGQSSSLTSPLISPFSGSPLSSGYHTPVFFSPAKPRPSQTQSLRCSPPHVMQPRHYSQTQSLRLSPPHELRRSPYRAPLVQLSAHDLEQDLRDRGGGWGRTDREKEWEREREREMERGWAQREWERERERGRLERERARERERRETTFGTFGYGRPAPLRSDRDSVFLEPDQMLDTTPLLLPQPSPSPSPSVAPRMGTGAVGRNRAGSKVGPESVGGGMVPKFDNVGGGLVLVESKSGCGAKSVSEVGAGSMSEVEIRAGIQEHHRAESWNKYDKASIKNGSETRMGSHVKTRPGGRDLEGKVQSGLELENMAPTVNREGHKGGARSGEKTGRVAPKPECIAEASAVTDTENNFGPGDKVEIGTGSGLEMKPEIEAQVEAKASSRQMENMTGTEAGGVDKFNNEVGSAADNRVEAEVDTEFKIAPTSEPNAVLKAGVSNETGAKSNSPTEVVSESQNSNKTTNKVQLRIVAEDNTDTTPADQVEKNTLDINRIECTHVEKGFRSQKSKSSKSSTRTRPGTATGLRPGVVSPRLSRGLRDLESTGPPEGIESTWPRRIIVRKRTVRQGGALHNLPILPPLPSVLSALEKRRPYIHLHPHPGHFSENLLTNAMNASIVGRCSLKESSHPEPGGQFVGRASLKEQNLEHWRICRDQEDPMRSRSKEKQGEQSKEKTEREERMGKEEERERERREIKDKREEKVGKEKERVTVSEGLVEDTRQDKSERRFEEKLQEDGNKKEDMKKEKDIEIKSEKAEDRGMKIKDGIEERDGQGLEEVVAKLKREEGEMEGGDRGTFAEEGGMESWDAVLEMVTTLWDDGWEKGGAGEGGGDMDSFSGSLQRWPLLRPPIGFGGSHPPSSAASELSLTELERRARELDSDLEHLDLSQPHRDTQDFYQTLLEPQRERADMYQTHPGPQREKAAFLTGVGSRSHVSLELSSVAAPSTDTERPLVDWSTKPTGTSTVSTSSTKEDSSPDSNLTLESDSSGVFLSLSNQSPEEASSDSDQPISGSDLDSSSTSLERDGDDGGLKEWGREESAELQWCYPSLLNTSLHEDIGGGKIEEAEHGKMGEDEERGKNENGGKAGKIGMVSVIQTPLDHTDTENSMTLNAPQNEEISRKEVTLVGSDTPLPLSPSKQPIKHLLDLNRKPIRSSGLDCGDLDPFVQSDSFVYLAVSARPASRGEVTTVTEVPTHGIKQDAVPQHLESKKMHLDQQSNTERDGKQTHLAPQKPEEGDFLCTDSFVYLAAPACLLLGPAGTTPYSGRESDSESSGSGPVDLSVLVCGSVAGDSDWDSDLSDSDPSRSSRISAADNKSISMAQPKRVPAELGWDLFGETTESEVLSELFREQDRNNNGKAKEVTGVTTSMVATQAIPMATQPVTTPMKLVITGEQSSATKKVTWQFKPAQRSVCTGSRKEKEKEVTSSSLVRFTELGGGETHRPSPSSSSSSSSSPSSSSSG